MATGDDPVAASSTEVTDTPPAAATPAGEGSVQAAPGEPERIPLPPLPASPAVVPEGFLRRLRLLDGLLVHPVLVLAFLAASYRAANSDVFLHLAAGRFLAQNGFTWTDPFTFAAQGVWVNHSWLFDLGLYFLYTLTGADG